MIPKIELNWMTCWCWVIVFKDCEVWLLPLRLSLPIFISISCYFSNFIWNFCSLSIHVNLATQWNQCRHFLAFHYLYLQWIYTLRTNIMIIIFDSLCDFKRCCAPYYVSPFIPSFLHSSSLCVVDVTPTNNSWQKLQLLGSSYFQLNIKWNILRIRRP